MSRIYKKEYMAQTVIIIALILFLLTCFAGLIYIFVMFKEMVEEQRIKDKEFFTDVMNRLMSENSDEYAYLSGDLKPQEEQDDTLIQEEESNSLDEMSYSQYKEKVNEK